MRYSVREDVNLGKGEVESSILSCGTSAFPCNSKQSVSPASAGDLSILVGTKREHG